jgi:hypothetical protein
VKPPWTVASQAQFASSFERTNYRFKYFDLVLESGGDPIDVVFNYKDLAHLKVVHNTFDIFYSHISDDVQSCVVMQKLFGLSFPLTHIALQLDQNRLFFHDSFLNVLLTSEVVAEALPDHRVKVTTTYGIGAPKWLLPFVFPILKRLLTRNYHVLMEGDGPMRDRRGDLRRWGLRLPKASYSFQETLDLRARNVMPSPDVPAPQPASVAFASIPADRPVLFGKSDHYDAGPAGGVRRSVSSLRRLGQRAENRASSPQRQDRGCGLDRRGHTTGCVLKEIAASWILCACNVFLAPL